MRAALRHHYDVIWSRDVIGHVTIRQHARTSAEHCRNETLRHIQNRTEFNRRLFIECQIYATIHTDYLFTQNAITDLLISQFVTY